MALTATEKKEIETIVRKEIKDFLGATTVKNFEKDIINKISTDLKKGELRGDINEIIVHMISEFYYLMCSRRNQLQITLKNRK